MSDNFLTVSLCRIMLSSPLWSSDIQRPNSPSYSWFNLPTHVKVNLTLLTQSANLNEPCSCWHLFSLDVFEMRTCDSWRQISFMVWESMWLGFPVFFSRLALRAQDINSISVLGSDTQQSHFMLEISINNVLNRCKFLLTKYSVSFTAVEPSAPWQK